MTALMVLACVLALLFSSCDNFFSKNLIGSPRSYNPDKIGITASNSEEWFNATIGNNPLRIALIAATDRELKNPSLSPDDRAVLVNLRLRLTIDSAGLVESILTVGAESLKDIKFEDLDESFLENLLTDILDDFISKGGAEAADDIIDLLIDHISGKGKNQAPTFEPGFADNFKAGDVAETILILILAEMAGIEDFDSLDLSFFEKFILGLEVKDGHIVVSDEGEATEMALVLAAYINLIVDDESGKYESNPLTNLIKEAFLGLDN